MKICFLSSMHPPRDKRVFDKEAVSLAQAGFDVVHLAPSEEENTSERGVEIITYRRMKGIIGRILQISRLYRLAAKIDADVYHCNEVDSWFVGVLLKMAHRKKVVFDVHEHYPSTFAESRFPRWLGPLIAGTIRLIYRILTPLTDRIVFAKRSVVVDFSGSEQKHLLVQNFTLLVYRDVEQKNKGSHKQRNSETSITAIHLGLISRARGWPQLLEALAEAESKNLHLCIIGTFTDGSQDEFKNSVMELGLNDRIFVEKWMPFEQAYQRVLSSDIGLVLFQPGIQNHVYALPHKMFDYMLGGLPVIAPKFATEVSHFIKEADCGILIDTSNPDEIAKALDGLVNDEQGRRRLGENGRRAVLEHHNWESEAKKLVNMYEKMASEIKRQTLSV